jgi:multidrug efflux pump
MLTATFLATFLIPMFFVVVSNRLGKRKRHTTLAAAGGIGSTQQGVALNGDI